MEPLRADPSRHPLSGIHTTATETKGKDDRFQLDLDSQFHTRLGSHARNAQLLKVLEIETVENPTPRYNPMVLSNTSQQVRSPNCHRWISMRMAANKPDGSLTHRIGHFVGCQYGSETPGPRDAAS